MDIVEVTGRTLESCKFLGLVPSDILGDEDYNVYVRWHADGTIRADRSDTDRMIVAAHVGKAGKAAALVQLMENISRFYGRKVTVAVDPGTKVPAAMAKVIGEHDGRPVIEPVTVNEVADVIGVVKVNGRVFVAEAYSFGRPAAFKRAVDLGFLLLVDNVDTGSQWILSAQQAWNVHYANATSNDKAISNSDSGPYKASLNAFLLAWSVQFPDIPVESAHDIMVSGDNDVAWAVEYTREDMAVQAAIARGEAAFDLVYGKLREEGQPDRVVDYIASAVQDMATGGRHIIIPAAFKIEFKLPCVCWIFFGWDRSNIPVGGFCCPGCGSLFTTPDVNVSDPVAAYQRSIRAHNDYADQAIASIGDTIYRESDGHQGVIADISTDGMPMITFNGGQSTVGITLPELRQRGYEVIPAAEVVEGQERADRVSRDHARGVKVNRPFGKLLNRRKRKATRRNRARVGGGF